MSVMPNDRTLPLLTASSGRCQEATSITDGGSVSGDRKLKESTPRLAPGRPQPPTMGFDNRAADREAHAHAVGLRRVEWFKETRQSFRAQPGAGVLHPEAHLVRFRLAGSDEHLSGAATGTQPIAPRSARQREAYSRARRPGLLPSFYSTTPISRISRTTMPLPWPSWQNRPGNMCSNARRAVPISALSIR